MRASPARTLHAIAHRPRSSACEEVADRRRLARVRAVGEGRWVTHAELIVVLVKAGSAVTVALSGLVPGSGCGCGAGSSW